MTIMELLRAGGRASPGEFKGQAELTRHWQPARAGSDADHVVWGRRRREILRLTWFSRAQLMIKESPVGGAGERSSVGEVRFPGEYPIRRGETRRRSSNRGTTDLAVKEGAVFPREDLSYARAALDLTSACSAPCEPKPAEAAGDGAPRNPCSAARNLPSQVDPGRGRIVISLDDG